MKIAAAQTQVHCDIAANGAAIRQMLVDAAAAGAELVLFCEGALLGYAKAQIASPQDWHGFDWDRHDQELTGIAALCGQLGVVAVVGGAHRPVPGQRPHNSLFVLSSAGKMLARYDKRFLSHNEISDWYSPGTTPVVFEAGGYRFGCAICIEVQFPEVFMEYEALGVDAVLFASYGIPEQFGIALRAHASLNCLWIAGATPAQQAEKGPAGIIGPDGKVIALCVAANEPGYAIATLDRDDPAFDIALNKARPWRLAARKGDIYRVKLVADPGLVARPFLKPT